MQLFPSDRVRHGKERIVFEAPVTVACSAREARPCARYLVERLRARGCRARKRDGKPGHANTVTLALRRTTGTTAGESFSISVCPEAGKATAVLEGGNLAALYHAANLFLREAGFEGGLLATRLRSARGAPRCSHRNLIIQLSWMEMLNEFPHYGLDGWKRFIDLASELRFTRIDFMQWGCTHPPAPPGQAAGNDEWEAWQGAPPGDASSWPMPAAYRGLKYQERMWKSSTLYEPWLFPLSGRMIASSEEFSVCLPPARSHPLARWLPRRGLLARGNWLPPFIAKPDLFPALARLIHDRGMRVGLFTTARVPCAVREKAFAAFWSEAISFFRDQGVDDFLFETEEGPASFAHHGTCKKCQAAFGDIFTGYTRKVARQTEIIGGILAKTAPASQVGWILHVPLAGGYGNTPERKEWLKKPDAYMNNLRLFESLAPKTFTLDLVLRPGSYGINHDFIPRAYYEVFGPGRIRETGYTHAWGPARSFRGLEAYYINLARALWNYARPGNGSAGNWEENVTGRELRALSKALYNSPQVLRDLGRYSINNRRTLFGEKSAVSPLVWDRSAFCIGEQVLKKMLSTAHGGRKSSYLPYSAAEYRKTLAGIRRAETRLGGIKAPQSILACAWDFRVGFRERVALVRACRFAIEFMLAYDRLLVAATSGRRIDRRALNNLARLGARINDAAVEGYAGDWWPSTSRTGGLFDYFAFARWLAAHPAALKM